MSYRRDFTKPYHVELIANKKAVQLKKDGIEWHEISKQLNISCEELNHIIENYNQIQTNDRATGTIIEPINSVNLPTTILLEDAEHRA
jgi:orotate phosphoribosyltransferase-like protein